MITPSSRFVKIRTAVVIFSIVGLLSSVGWAIIGVMQLVQQGQTPLVDPSSLVLIGMIFQSVLSLIGIILLWSLLWVLIKAESNSFRQYDQSLNLADILKEQNKLLDQISRNAQISDSAKAITHRTTERDAVLLAIREEIAREDWDAALFLVDQMEERFGYRDEAHGLRQKVVENRSRDMRRRFEEAKARIEKHWDACEWILAEQEIERLIRILPDDKRAKRLREEHAERQDLRKKALLADWSKLTSDKNDVSDVERAIEIIRELDPFLTREESRDMEEGARSVFKARAEQLGMQFEYAVRDQRWRDSLEIGLQIVEEFPNSRMAQEFREMESKLREKAGLSSDVEVTARAES